jgi:hypothetical protein
MAGAHFDSIAELDGAFSGWLPIRRAQVHRTHGQVIAVRARPTGPQCRRCPPCPTWWPISICGGSARIAWSPSRGHFLISPAGDGEDRLPRPARGVAGLVVRTRRLRYSAIIRYVALGQPGLDHRQRVLLALAWPALGPSERVGRSPCRRWRLPARPAAKRSAIVDFL